MINTALIQEQIAMFNRLAEKTLQTNHRWQFEQIRDQWLEILAAVEQQGNQEPVTYVEQISKGCRLSGVITCMAYPISGHEQPLYASPVQPAAEKTGWQPISTAKPNVRILTCLDDGKTICAGELFEAEDGTAWKGRATHWMPLPSPPKQESDR